MKARILVLRDRPRVATIASFATFLPLFVWWLGWFPGLMSSDSIDQWNQTLTFEFYNAHPISHTASLWAISLFWESPGAVALVQVVGMAALLGIIAKRLAQLGIPLWMSIGTVWLIAVLPMTAITTITIWKDIPFTLAMGWAFTELMLMAIDRERFWSHVTGPIRLGVALGAMWALRANGRYTVIVLGLALAFAFRHHLRATAAFGTAIVAVGIGVPTLLVAVLPVHDQPIEVAQVFMPDVAAVVVHAEQSLSQQDLALIAAVAPLDVWRTRYDCGDSSPLLFDESYDNRVIQQDPWGYRMLVLRAGLGAPGTVAGHRWCAGEYLVSPFNRTGTFVHRPPYDIWPNTLGLGREPISDRAFAATDWMYRAVETASIEWLTWRPAIYVLAGLGTFIGITARRRLRPLLWIALLFVVHLANVFISSPSHEFRYAFGLYLISLAMLPVWYLIVDPARSAISEPVSAPGV
ncbi:MAG: DUF6020 family protein [Acidimicrobiia bacterium]